MEHGVSKEDADAIFEELQKEIHIAVSPYEGKVVGREMLGEIQKKIEKVLVDYQEFLPIGSHIAIGIGSDGLLHVDMEIARTITRENFREYYGKDSSEE